MSAIDPDSLATLEAEHDVIMAVGADSDTLAALIERAEVAILRSGTALTAPLIGRAPRLRLVIRAGSGTDNIDLEELERRRISLWRIPEPGADAVAEMTLTLMLALSRHVVQADRELRDGRWRKTAHVGISLIGRTLGVVGAGNIGTRVGVLGRSLGMHVQGCVEHPGPAARERLAAHGIALTELDQLLATSDFISVHVPLTARTRRMIDAAALARARPGSYLLNLARGGVVDEDALRDALLSGHLAGAALDVHAQEGEPFTSPVQDLPNVILTPHIGASSVQAQRRIGERIVGLVRTQAPFDDRWRAETAAGHQGEEDRTR